MVSVLASSAVDLASSAVDLGFESRSRRTKDYEIGMCGFSAKPAALRRKSKDNVGQHVYPRTVVSVS